MWCKVTTLFRNVYNCLDVYNTSKTNLWRMFITSQNKIPHCNLYVGLGKYNDIIGVLFLYDTRATLNIIIMYFHLQIMKQYLKIVARFKIFVGDNPFDQIKLFSDITHSSDYSVENHGIRGAVVEYHTLINMATVNSLHYHLY